MHLAGPCVPLPDLAKGGARPRHRPSIATSPRSGLATEASVGQASRAPHRPTSRPRLFGAAFRRPPRFSSPHPSPLNPVVSGIFEPRARARSSTPSETQICACSWSPTLPTRPPPPVTFGGSRLRARAQAPFDQIVAVCSVSVAHPHRISPPLIPQNTRSHACSQGCVRSCELSNCSEKWTKTWLHQPVPRQQNRGQRASKPCRGA
mmetsp:Transcript_33116/g.85397  ORF Transcript_33116/g.85397 Transcript_33116/m.85397 type:complete len:206 (-) Transcript_33116:122-739(-)